jgi:hypothetical protein
VILGRADVEGTTTLSSRRVALAAASVQLEKKKQKIHDTHPDR